MISGIMDVCKVRVSPVNSVAQIEPDFLLILRKQIIGQFTINFVIRVFFPLIFIKS